MNDDKEGIKVIVNYLPPIIMNLIVYLQLAIFILVAGKIIKPVVIGYGRLSV